MSTPGKGAFDEALAILKDNFEFQCRHALERLERNFLRIPDDDRRQLDVAVEEAVDSVEIALGDLKDAYVNRENSRLVTALKEAVQTRTEPLLQAHVERCCREYAEDLERACMAISPRAVPNAGQAPFSAQVREMVVAHSMSFILTVVSGVVRSQCLGLAMLVFFTVVSPLAWTLVLAGGAVALFSKRQALSLRQRLRKRLKAELKPLLSADPPVLEGRKSALRDGGVLYQVWHQIVRRDREADVQRLWRGTNPDGAPVKDEQGNVFPGLEQLLRQMLGMEAQKGD